MLPKYLPHLFFIPVINSVDVNSDMGLFNAPNPKKLLESVSYTQSGISQSIMSLWQDTATNFFDVLRIALDIANDAVFAISLSTTLVNSSKHINGSFDKIALARSTRIFSPVDSTSYGLSHEGGEAKPHS